MSATREFSSRGTHYSGYLTLVGNGTTTNLNTNTGSVASYAKYVATTKRTVETIGISISDTKNFEPTLYGMATALTQGVVIQHRNSSGTVLSTLTNAMKTNRDVALRFPHNQIYVASTTNQHSASFMDVKFMFGKSILMLPNDDIYVYLKDDMTGLLYHEIVVYGCTCN
jgi:hypothetical protein